MPFITHPVLSCGCYNHASTRHLCENSCGLVPLDILVSEGGGVKGVNMLRQIGKEIMHTLSKIRELPKNTWPLTAHTRFRPFT